MANPNTELILLNDRLNELLRTLSTGIQTEIRNAIANGVDREATIRNIINQLRNGTGRLGGIVNAIGNTPTQTIRQVFTETHSQAVSAIALKQPPNIALPASQGYQVTYKPDGGFSVRAKGTAPSVDQRLIEQAAQMRGEQEMMWVAVYIKTCPDCIALSGQVKTMREWKESGYWPGNGHTVCGANCKCQIVPMQNMKSLYPNETTKQIQQRLENGIALQKRKIEEIEKIRGEKYADSTYMQKLGQMRNDFFNPNYKTKDPVFLAKEPKGLPTDFVKEVKKAYD